MLTYDMTRCKGESLYVYLYECIRTDIEQGFIQAASKLPSKRALAQHLSISVITVQNAYAQLVAEGYVEARQRSGYYVNELPQSQFRMQGADVPNPKNRSLQKSSANSLMMNMRPGNKQGNDAKKSHNEVSCDDEMSINLMGSSQSDKWFPLAAWSKAIRATLSQEPEAELMRKTGVFGHERLRCAIAQHVCSSRGLEADPEQIVIGAGAQSLYPLIVQVLNNPSSVALEDPGYLRLNSIYRALGLQTYPIQKDSDGICIADLKKSQAKLVHLMPSHQFPSGDITSAPRRYELLAWACEEENRYIIEDDYDCQFRLAGRPLPTLQGLDMGQRVIYMNTFTKSMGSSLRIAYMILPYNLTDKMHAELSFYSSDVSTIEQLVLARFLESGAYDRHVNRVRTKCRDLRDALIDALKHSDFADKLYFYNEDAGLSFLLLVDGIDAEQGAMRLAKHGVRVQALSHYFMRQGSVKKMTPAQKSCFVIDYSTLDKSQIPAVVKAFEILCS